MEKNSNITPQPPEQVLLPEQVSLETDILSSECEQPLMGGERNRTAQVLSGDAQENAPTVVFGGMDTGRWASGVSETVKQSQGQVDSGITGDEGPIGTALAVESLIAVGCSVVIGAIWGLHSGLSALLGSGAYLFPYAIVYFVFFYRFAGWHRASDERARAVADRGQKQQAKRKRTIVGGFVLAEIVKIGLTLGILIAAVMWYRQADWSVVLISFAVAIQANWVALWFALRRAA